MDCRTLGLPVHHQLLEFTQTHVHWVSDAVQPFHLLSFPSPAFNLSQHQGLFWVSSSHQVAKVLDFQHLCFQWIVRNSGLISWIRDELVGSACAPRDSQESPTPQFKNINSSELSFLYSPTLTSKDDYRKNQQRWTFVGKVMSLLFNMLSRLS